MCEELLSVKDVAGRLGITPRAVRQRIHGGTLTAVRVRGRYGAEWRIVGEVLDDQHRGDDDTLLSLPDRAADTMTPAPVQALAEQMEVLRSVVAELSGRLEQLVPDSSGHEQSPCGAEPDPTEGALAAIVRHLSELERRVEEESRLRRREAQELQAGIQALLAGLHTGAFAEPAPEGSEAEPAERRLGARARTWLRGPRR